jgi:hypothetical protein
MENLVEKNTQLLFNASVFICNALGNNDLEFGFAVIDVLMSQVCKFYKDKGIEFNAATMIIEEDALLAGYDRIMELASLACLVKELGLSCEDLGL